MAHRRLGGRADVAVVLSCKEKGMDLPFFLVPLLLLRPVAESPARRCGEADGKNQAIELVLRVQGMAKGRP